MLKDLLRYKANALYVGAVLLAVFLFLVANLCTFLVYAALGASTFYLALSPVAAP